MKIARIAMQEKETLTGEKRTYPYTFFSLTNSERSAYDKFREQHNLLRSSPQGKTPEKARLEEEVDAMFLDLVKPPFKKWYLDPQSCGIYYGPEKDVVVHFPTYLLFGREERPDIGTMSLTCWFTVDEELSCRSRTAYSSLMEKSFHEGRVIQDLVENYIKRSSSKEQIYFEGGFIHFAPVNFAIPIMDKMRRILAHVGPESFEELLILQGHIASLRGDDRRTSILIKVLNDAYQAKLQMELETYDLVTNH